MQTHTHERSLSLSLCLCVSLPPCLSVRLNLSVSVCASLSLSLLTVRLSLSGNDAVRLNRGNVRDEMGSRWSGKENWMEEVQVRHFRSEQDEATRTKKKNSRGHRNTRPRIWGLKITIHTRVARRHQGVTGNSASSGGRVPKQID